MDDASGVRRAQCISDLGGVSNALPSANIDSRHQTVALNRKTVKECWKLDSQGK
jgi:hypothetical protein